MRLGLSTRWNSRRHTRGEAMIEEILALGFREVELGYELTRDLLPGVQRMVASRSVRVASVHGICPVPMGVSRGSPEVFTLSDPDATIRRKAVDEAGRTIRLAAELQATVVVLHAGYARMRPRSVRLFQLLARGPAYERRAARLRDRILARRDRGAPKPLELLRRGIEALLPVLQETGVRLALENMPTWEGLPTEIEAADLVGQFGPERLGYWHDMGHARIREWAGFINHARLLERMMPHVAGVHVHDVRLPDDDHRLPFEGEIDFESFRETVGRFAGPRILEPSADAPADRLKEAAERLDRCWSGAGRDDVALAVGSSIYDAGPGARPRRGADVARPAADGGSGMAMRRPSALPGGEREQA
jgi:sugar phosphate isomerase/epimerase